MAAATEIEGEKVEGTKGVQGFVKTRLARVQTQLDGLGDKVKLPIADLRKTINEFATKRLDELKGLLKKAPVARVEKAVNDGVKLTEDAVQKLGLAKIADVSALKDAFETMQKRIDQLKKRVDSLVKTQGKAPASEAEAK
jgi:division protein CdvB (Snf7/Vps24/ESCRT-III family)